jgi:bifunctional aspartokinase / homoserine dehydrogenase 1
MRQSAKIVWRASESTPVVVICSAMGGVTDKLIEGATLASQRATEYQQVHKELYERHQKCMRALQIDESVSEPLEALFESLREVLRGVFLLGECTLRTHDLIMSFGERMSSLLMSAYLRTREPSTKLIDTRLLLKTDHQFGNARIKREESYQNIRNHITGVSKVYVVPGFIASTDKGESTTLGRGGSDYTASLFGAALSTDEIQLWTDVSGVLSADPRFVTGAQPISEMTYEEAMEMSHFGAKVIYPPTIQPAREMGIPIVIKNTFEPDHPGTKIHSFGASKGIIKGISTIYRVSLIHVSGSGMVGITGIAGQLFSALAQAGINIIMISQGSSEHSICAVIAPEHALHAQSTLKAAFALEILRRQIDEISIQDDLSVIAVTGERMRHSPGISGKIFGALGDYGINVVAVAQGSSERNISIVVREDQVSEGMQVIHDRFFTQKRAPLQVVVVGTGLVGGTLLEQMMARKDLDPTIMLCGVVNSRQMLLHAQGIDSTHLNERGEKADLQRVVDWFKAAQLPHPVFVDCTASDAPVRYYEELLQAGISVVTPNKRATSSDFAAYKRLKKAPCGSVFRFETTVGAGLPVIGVIQSLIASGDKINKIEGTLSGTLSYLFNTYTPEMSFTSLLREAQEKGYTEPDPRDDLSGMDVARKLLILAREIGLPLELEDIEVENLVPEDCRGVEGLEAFFEALTRHDALFSSRLSQARAHSRVLRYVTQVAEGKASVSLEAVGEDHPCYTLAGSDNLISFTTDRYCDRPLVVRGPGAGARVTAAGVLADILSCSP